jgi:hypothetical protein
MSCCGGGRKGIEKGHSIEFFWVITNEHKSSRLFRGRKNLVKNDVFLRRMIGVDEGLLHAEENGCLFVAREI